VHGDRSAASEADDNFLFHDAFDGASSYLAALANAIPPIINIAGIARYPSANSAPSPLGKFAIKKPNIRTPAIAMVFPKDFMASLFLKINQRLARPIQKYQL
jgi:hypothetical protein